MKITTTKTVEDITKLNFIGNVIPEAWYTSPFFISKTPNGKTSLNLKAVVIYSDILYWYRATIIKNEETGKVIERKKKFAADKLQYNYEPVSEKFGLTERQVRTTISFLHKRFLLRRIVRNVTVGKLNIPNRVFIEPYVPMVILSLEDLSEIPLDEVLKTLDTALTIDKSYTKQRAYAIENIYKLGLKHVAKNCEVCRKKLRGISQNFARYIAKNCEHTEVPIAIATSSNNIDLSSNDDKSLSRLSNDEKCLDTENPSPLSEEEEKSIGFVDASKIQTDLKNVSGFDNIRTALRELWASAKELKYPEKPLPFDSKKYIEEESKLRQIYIDAIYTLTGESWVRGKELREARLLYRMVMRKRTFKSEEVIECLLWLLAKGKLYDRSLLVVRKSMPDFLELKSKGVIDYEQASRQYENSEERKSRILKSRKYNEIAERIVDEIGVKGTS